MSLIIIFKYHITTFREQEIICMSLIIIYRYQITTFRKQHVWLVLDLMKA